LAPPVNETKARRAAEALSGAATKAAFADLISRTTEVEATLTLHSWMLGILAVAAVGTFIEALLPS
jgi:hypothetical protein